MYKSDESKQVADNALIALTLLIAESKPEEKVTMIKVVVSPTEMAGFQITFSAPHQAHIRNSKEEE